MEREDLEFNPDEITLGDVALAIKILKEFLRRYREAHIILAEASRVYKSMRSPRGSLEDFVGSLLAQSLNTAGSSGSVEVDTGEFTPEEIERIKTLKRKLKGESSEKTSMG